jgi:excisionase family DNA binding protein
MQLGLETATRTTFSAQEVAEHLAVSERTVRRWIAEKKLPAQKSGRSFSIRIDDVERVLGASVKRRIAGRAEGQEREQELAGVKAQLSLLKELYASAQAELAEERKRVARLEYELEAATARAA